MTLPLGMGDTEATPGSHAPGSAQAAEGDKGKEKE